MGRRNAGKSSLINAITGEEVSIVSDTPGTTTDAVAKHYELLPVGPVTFYDTAGLDDTGDLGLLRVEATRKVLWRTDIAVLVTDQGGITEYEERALDELNRLDIPALIVSNKIDVSSPSVEILNLCASRKLKHVGVSARTRKGLQQLRETLISLVPADIKQEPVLVGDLILEGDFVLCVVPIDLAAPKGRLILPQVQVLREILDCDAVGVVVKEREIEEALFNMQRRPSLVVTDSQVILKVAGDVDKSIRLTTFSILFARFKGDLEELVRGAKTISTLEDGDRVLMSEACSHHIQADDIGRVKIPRWINQFTGKDVRFEVFSGHDFPENLEDYRLVVHCGACMLNRSEMIRRIRECRRRGVAITNYGVAISKVQGVLDRVISPFRRH